MHRDGIADSLLEVSMNSRKLTVLTIIAGLLCLVEVARVPAYTRHNVGDWIFQMRTRVLPARLPHTIQLCIHCRDRPAGSAAPAVRQCVGPGACPAARDWTVTAAM
jgi:hypothetical protein